MSSIEHAEESSRLPKSARTEQLRAGLERLYEAYNRPCFVEPDPLQFLRQYADPLDREVAGIIASSLAFGQVAQIIAGVQSVLDRMAAPRAFLLRATRPSLARAFTDFRHRYVTGRELADMLWGVRSVLARHGSLGRCFTACLASSDDTVLPALTQFVDCLREDSTMPRNYLLPSPRRGSACKRLNLFLRWMVRRDEVDLGGWDGVCPALLIVPIDTHMHRFAKALGLTTRKQADMRTALEVTAGFRRFAPHDPVRFDFALTRLGIRKDANSEALLNALGLSAGPHLL